MRDVLFALPWLPSEHPAPVVVALIGAAVYLANKYGALPRFPWRVPASRITPRTPEQAAADNQRIVDIRTATKQIRAQFDDDGDGRRIVHPIVTFEKEYQALSTVQRGIRLEQANARRARRVRVLGPNSEGQS